jgi:7,8-dihydro-6-hydroxymethylpterin-pyrophosphokinase
MNSDALVLFEVEISEGLSALKEMLKQLGKDRVAAVSSVCRREGASPHSGLGGKMILVLRAKISEESLVINKKLKRIEGLSLRRRAVLLARGQWVEIDPENPLPHPDLALDGSVLRCASEIWGDFFHPMLGQSLQEIVNQRDSQNGPQTDCTDEFIFRGDKLLEEA